MMAPGCSATFWYGVLVAYGAVALFLGGYVFRDRSAGEGWP